MLITSHAIIGYLLYRKRPLRERWLAIVGSVIPDSVFLFVVPVLLLVDSNRLVEAIRSHSDIYISSMDYIVGSFLNSLWIWLMILMIGGALWRTLLPVAIGGIVHIIADLITHQGQWAWNHFYPLPVAPIQGIVDYADYRFFLIEHVIFFILLYPSIAAWYLQKKTMRMAPAQTASH